MNTGIQSLYDFTDYNQISFFSKSFLIFLTFCVRVQPINIVVIVSGEQQRDSAIHIYVSILSQREKHRNILSLVPITQEKETLFHQHTHTHTHTHTHICTHTHLPVLCLAEASGVLKDQDKKTRIGLPRKTSILQWGQEEGASLLLAMVCFSVWVRLIKSIKRSPWQDSPLGTMRSPACHQVSAQRPWLYLQGPASPVPPRPEDHAPPSACLHPGLDPSSSCALPSTSVSLGD